MNDTLLTLDDLSLQMPLLLLYTSPKLAPLIRPSANTVLSRLSHPGINYGYPPQRWYVVPPNRGQKDPTEKQSTAEREKAIDSDPRIVFGETEFKTVRDKYNVPRHVSPRFKVSNDKTLVLCHGLLGFDVINIGGFEPVLPPLAKVHYWRGIKEGLEQAGCSKVVITRVPRTATIEERAETLREEISKKCQPNESINILGHSMGGLDARYMLSVLKPTEFHVKSLTTIATPHRGSTFADYVYSYFVSPDSKSSTPSPTPPPFFRFLDSLGVKTGAFEELTTENMRHFNEHIQNRPDIRYFSFGASFTPTWGSVFRTSHDIIEQLEGPNDGLVSVKSAMWGEYKGTIRNVNHLDIINWTNRIKYWWNGVLYGAEWAEPQFNAIAFYLHVADMLAEEGL